MAIRRRMNRMFSAVAFSLSVVTVSQAQTIAPGSIEDLADVCSFSATPKELRVINATAFLVANDPSVVTHNSDGTYTINFDALVYDDDFAQVVCPTSQFYGEPHIPGAAGRTGFLIAPNKIMTAPHHITGTVPGQFNPSAYLVIFRPSLISQGAGCTDFTWINIPASDVYLPTGVIDANTVSVGAPSQYDYAVFELDRPVTDRAPLKIRRSGQPRVGDAIFTAGFPERLGEKSDTAAIMAAVYGQTPLVPDYASDGYPEDSFIYNLHEFPGSSGSPVYNEDTDVVEVVEARGQISWRKDESQNCLYAGDLPTSLQNPTNSPVADVQNYIPRAEVLVSPTEYVNHIVDLGSPPIVNSYSITTARYNSTGDPLGGELIEMQKTTWPSGASDPNLTLSATAAFYNVPANGMTFDIASDFSNVNSCGIWEYALNVFDVTNDQNNIIRHRFEVGLREFSLTPSENWIVNDFGPPYQNSKVYQIKNVRPTATHVLVAQDGTMANSNLVLINGLSTAAFDLGPAGTSTDTATFSLTVNAAAASSTTAGVTYQGRIAIYNQPFNCSVASESNYIYRDFTFERGEQVVGSSPLFTLITGPTAGQTYGATKRFDFDLSSEASTSCISDINVYVGAPPTGGAPTIDILAANLKVQLTAPDGTTGTLWQSNSITGMQYEKSIDLATGGSVPAFYLDDQTAPPLGPTLLSAFNGRKLQGHWYIDLGSAWPSTFNIGPVQIDATIGGTCAGK